VNNLPRHATISVLPPIDAIRPHVFQRAGLTKVATGFDTGCLGIPLWRYSGSRWPSPIEAGNPDVIRH
jgi:hypothetical protein